MSVPGLNFRFLRTLPGPEIFDTNICLCVPTVMVHTNQRVMKKLEAEEEQKSLKELEEQTRM